MQIKKFLIIGSIAAVITAAICFLYFSNPVEIFLQQIAGENLRQKTFLASPYNNIENYQDVFLKLPKIIENPNIKAGVISHHFLAKELIANFYNKISNKNIDTIFLISPDHYNNFFASGVTAYTSDLYWDTPFGVLESDEKIVNSLAGQGTVEKNNSLMGLEHGIYVEVPFIKKFFPNAKIVPLVLNTSANFNNFSDLGAKLKNLAGKKSILIVSSDFSHDIPAKEAGIKDKDSIQILKNLTLDNAKNINSDCPKCFAVLYGFLQNANNYNFNLINNKNSFDYEGDSEDSVTSYVSGFFEERKYVQILFTGDLMFDRGIRYYAQKNESNEFIFEKIYPLLINNDLVVSNLEGPITNEKSISSGTAPGSANNYFFTFDSSLAKTLYRENIKIVSLGNNHILNFAWQGLESTKEYLDGAGVGYFGAPEEQRNVIKEMGGVRIGFISYNEFYGDNEEEQNAVLEEIKDIKQKSDLVIVFSHWGPEYRLTSTDTIKDLAHKFIDGGADLIIGSHPHVIVPMEEYKGKRIYYSLGNFVFDQYFDENVRNGMGIVVKVNLETKQLNFEEIKFYLQSGGQTIEK
ncbi:MAG: AmmeMemoRadiSam system protein B [Candidatus Staskawiczbacteria bacterium RIFOXYD1_FULL_37_73]|nr:MAG: AmmeMemoRadiSam system protein B [Candidatus Staskawiczbacteria bacterium RIFOXYA12_FULL_37_10]OGZ79924.1 MAG: AmmeMemoRadiSam system protein B [Candidatus Staskawiczbacteria bacterium RIFOXYB1_FULL_38_37]OGZ83073.1 MAG: AmmeMemoRadiSam system protein B [Candidatus Staskawiczbacteria bacterium RIFOXYB2_FULL_37_10]OGZ85339.1 MAG: AmmeMemoRadiSam system protein B [Candidatus Staskawiczbacteria bacterium RIFOXYC12_FULL_39_20]OGZ86456.1 MAG: AmmeMemoRadiSam system protein B [Candidatus Stas